MLTKIQNQSVKTYLTNFGYSLFGKYEESRSNRNGNYGYNIFNINGGILLKGYVTNITDEITTYAADNIYATPTERQEFREEILKNTLKNSSLISISEAYNRKLYRNV
jgi:hypothetical protein